MYIPYIVSSIFVLGVVILCFFKPKIGRIFLGFFYIFLGIIVHGIFIIKNPESYINFGNSASIQLYRELTTHLIALNPVVFGFLLMVFEVIMGLLILNKNTLIKIGLIGTIIFLLALIPMGKIQLIWLGLIVGQMYLFKRDFNTTFYSIIQSKKRI